MRLFERKVAFPKPRDEPPSEAQMQRLEKILFDRALSAMEMSAKLYERSQNIRSSTSSAEDAVRASYVYGMMEMLGIGTKGMGLQRLKEMLDELDRHNREELISCGSVSEPEELCCDGVETALVKLPQNHKWDPMVA